MNILDLFKTSQFVALIIGAAFTIISIATTLLAFKYAKKLKSFTKAIILIIIAPFIASAAWLYLLFSYLDGLRKNEILAFVIAVLMSIFIFGMVVVVAKALYSKHGPALEAYDHALEEEKAVRDELAAQEKAEKDDTIEAEIAVEPEETQSTDLVVVNRKKRRRQLLLTDKAPEAEQAEEVTEEIVEAEAAEEPEETTTEQEKQTNNEDEEFDKLVEELRKKVEDDNNDNNGENK